MVLYAIIIITCHMHNMANIIPLTYQNAVACGDSVEALKQLNRKAFFNGMLYFHNIVLQSKFLD